MPAKKKIKIDISKLEVLDILPKTQVIKNIPDKIQSDSTNIKYGIELTPFFRLKGNLIKIDLTVKMSFENDANNSDLSNVAEFSYDFIYRYTNLKDLQDENNLLSPEIFLTCSNISYSTLRGIIYAKSADTCIANALIPIVTGAELMKGLKKGL
jgi:hypothetical protein